MGMEGRGVVMEVGVWGWRGGVWGWRVGVW